MEKVMDAFVVLKGDKYEGADIIGIRLSMAMALELVNAQKPRHEARPFKPHRYEPNKWVAGHEVLYIETYDIPCLASASQFSIEGSVVTE
jgi:hypothetical protein